MFKPIVRIALDLHSPHPVRVVTHRLDVAGNAEPESLRSERELEPGDVTDVVLHPGSCLTVFAIRRE